MIHADDGSDVEAFTPELNLRTAAAWSGQPATAAAVESLKAPDQWTVNGYRRIAPVTKYSWPNGEHVYISDETGEVAQYTTTASRIGGYIGPVAHWLYFTPLRRYESARSTSSGKETRYRCFSTTIVRTRLSKTPSRP